MAFRYRSVQYTSVNVQYIFASLCKIQTDIRNLKFVSHEMKDLSCCSVISCAGSQDFNLPYYKLHVPISNSCLYTKM
jgi:hypothetical protein